MRRFRTHVSLVLGLLLLVQGWAVAAAAAAAPMMALGAPDTAISAAAQTAEAEMPCHQQQADEAKPAKAQSGSASSCPCCDGNCPDMQACAAANPAMPSSLALDLPRRTAAAPSTVESRVAVRSNNSLLKPPISLQA